jgi:tRNA dimethylallyltransferase
MKKPKVLVIIGPTASGKTEHSINAATEIEKQTGKQVVIISADSRQIYKHIPVTTAQPSKEQLSLFKHHYIASHELNDDFNAGEFGFEGRKLINDIFAKGNIPVVVGGSGLYINSLVYGLFENNGSISKEKDIEVRSELYMRAEKEGIDVLLKELEEADPETVKNMPHKTTPRIIRALQAYIVTGIPISQHRRKKIDIDFEPVLTGIETDRQELYKSINARTEKMLNEGMLEEITVLKEKGFHYKTHNSLNTVGAKEVFDYLDNKIDKNRMLELIKQNTRRYAKRQLTWFRRDKNIKWIDIRDNLSSLAAALTGSKN